MLDGGSGPNTSGAVTGSTNFQIGISIRDEENMKSMIEQGEYSHNAQLLLQRANKGVVNALD